LQQCCAERSVAAIKQKLLPINPGVLTLVGFVSKRQPQKATDATL
jgi:hypothetical protein